MYNTAAHVFVNLDIQPPVTKQYMSGLMQIFTMFTKPANKNWEWFVLK